MPKLRWWTGGWPRLELRGPETVFRELGAPHNPYEQVGYNAELTINMGVYVPPGCQIPPLDKISQWIVQALEQNSEPQAQ